MKSWLRSRRFFMHALCLTISLLLVLCIFFVAALYTNSMKSSKQTVFRVEAERTTELLRQSDIYLQQAISTGYSYVTLDLPYEQITGGDDLFIQKTLDSMLRSHMRTNSYISNIDIEIRGKHLFPSSVAHERDLGIISFYKIYCQREATWPFQFDIVTSDKLHSNRVTLTLDGYFLSRQIFSKKTDLREEYLLLPDGTILLSNQKTAFFQNIHERLPGIDLDENSAIQEELGVYDDWYYVFSAPDKYGFRILSLVPQSLYASQHQSIVLQTILMSSSLFLVAILVSLYLVVQFYRPIKKTVAMLQTYIPDDLHEYENEIAYIHQNISKLKKSEGESLSQIQKAQTAVLQYQINSHFLFNTLENIKALSILALGMENRIENSIMLLNTIIREGILHKNIFVPLSHELHLSKCYLELMQLRFPDVKITWDIDETLSQCQVFKFSLQPVLENCFAHAFQSHTCTAKQISVRVQKDVHGFSIFVADNGSGIKEDVIRHLEQMLQTPDETENAGHVGIQNIQQRITDTFGPDYGIRFTSNSHGTVIELRYPISFSKEISG